MNIFVELLIGLGIFFFGAGYLGSKSKIYVAIILPFADSSGKVKILGAYRKKERAEAKIYRYIQTVGYEMPSVVVECRVNIDIDEQEPPPKGVLPIN